MNLLLWQIFGAFNSFLCYYNSWYPDAFRLFNINILYMLCHPASYPVGTRDPFPRGKAWLGRDADHSPPSSAEVKYE
jgi:hypothetical protein